MTPSSHRLSARHNTPSVNRCYRHTVGWLSLPALSRRRRWYDCRLCGDGLLLRLRKKLSSPPAAIRHKSLALSLQPTARSPSRSHHDHRRQCRAPSPSPRSICEFPSPTSSLATFCCAVVKYACAAAAVLATATAVLSCRGSPLYHPTSSLSDSQPDPRLFDHLLACSRIWSTG